MKLQAWWHSEPNNVHRPLLRLEERGDIEEYNTFDPRLWNKNPVKYFAELVKKWNWEWVMMERASQVTNLMINLLVTRLGKETTFYNANLFWDSWLEENPSVRRYWEEYLGDDRTKVVSMTEAASESLKEATGVKSDDVIPCCCNTDIFYPREVEDRDRPLALFVARLVPWKNTDLVIKLARNNPDYDFWLCGDGKLRDEVIEAEEELENLSYKGWLDSKDRLAKYFSKADVFIHPARRMGVITEEFGSVVIEALACETPVLAYNTAGPESVLEDIGVLVDQGEEEVFEDKLCDLLQDNERREKLGRKGRELVKKEYDIDVVADKWLKILED